MSIVSPYSGLLFPGTGGSPVHASNLTRMLASVILIMKHLFIA
jgi:hypothetical protein